jgi:uncharacterized protein (DUF2461 family)
MRTITKDELQNGFTHITDNYFVEIITGKTFNVLPLDDMVDCYALLEPEQYEDTMQTLTKNIESFIDKLANELRE